MHPNPIFRQQGDVEALAAARQMGFGVLTCVVEGEILASHVPFVLGEAERPKAQLHLVRSNPIARSLAAGECIKALLAVSGPHAYISPDWYGAADQVPTWNYQAVHLRGQLVALPDEGIEESVAALSERFEGLLAAQSGKALWTLDKMTRKTLEGMLRAIRPFELVVETVESTSKFGQNKTPEQRQGAAQGLKNSTIGSEIDQLIKLMQAVDLAGS